MPDLDETRRRRDRAKAKRSRKQQRIHDLRALLEAVEEKLASARADRDAATDDERREVAADRAEDLAREKHELERSIRETISARERWAGRYRRLRDRARRQASRVTDRAGWASKHFRYDEFNCHEGPPVPGYMYPHLRDLCARVLEPMRARFGACHVNSGHRWDFYNRKIGGASLSYHVYEDRQREPAADLTFASGAPSEWAAFARNLGVGGVGQYSTFVHVDTGPRRDWWG